MQPAKAILHDPVAKRRYNRDLFTIVAPRYRLITRLLSFGCDRGWKRALIGLLPAQPEPQRILDLACGTADLTILLARRFPRATVVGCDLTPAMLQRARTAVSRQTGTSLCCLDMARLAARDRSVDLICGGYALRNAPDLRVMVAEVQRVLRPGGCAAFLDFSRSPCRLLAALQFGLLKLWGGFWGVLMHGEPRVYGYIADSLASFPDRAGLHRLMREAGLQVHTSRLRMAGMIELLLVVKPTRPPA